MATPLSTPREPEFGIAESQIEDSPLEDSYIDSNLKRTNCLADFLNDATFNTFNPQETTTSSSASTRFEPLRTLTDLGPEQRTDINQQLRMETAKPLSDAALFEHTDDWIEKQQAQMREAVTNRKDLEVQSLDLLDSHTKRIYDRDATFGEVRYKVMRHDKLYYILNDTSQRIMQFLVRDGVVRKLCKRDPRLAALDMESRLDDQSKSCTVARTLCYNKVAKL